MTFRFAHPAALALIIIPVIILGLQFANNSRLPAPTLRYSDTRLVEGLSNSWRVRLRHVPDILRLLAWGLLVVALARPQSGHTQEVIRGQGIDIVLALDISGSMRVLDFAPQNRLEAALTVISDFINGRQFDRIGLVVFAQDAFQHAPPTLDYRTLQTLLGEVKLAPELGLPDGTAIGSGLASAANMLRASSAPSKVIVLLTDGANNAGALDPITTAEALAALDIRVYTIGVGQFDPTSFQQAGSIAPIDNDLDETTLQIIAETTKALFFRAEDLRDLQQIYDQIDMLEQSTIERQQFVRWREQAGIWIIAGLLLLLSERFFRHTIFQTIP